MAEPDVALAHVADHAGRMSPGSDTHARAADARDHFGTERLDDVIRAHVLEVLARSGWNRSETARRLGVHRVTQQRWLRAWDV